VIVDILGRAGTVLNFRAMTDKETGKPKGYGFAEFSDADSAYSAVRNLNDFELQGRKLRVDYANEKDARDAHAAHAASHPSGPTEGQAVPNRLPALPPGRELEHGLSAADNISKTLSTLPVAQLLDILVQMQNLVLNDPVQATQLLDRSPQLSYAIFQALLNLNLVDPSSLSSVIQQATVAPPAQPPQPAYQPAPVAPPPQQAYAQQPQYPTQYTPQPPQQYQAPPPPQPAAQPQVPDRNALIQQVMSMTQAQIDQMAPNDRQQIMALRAQLAQQFAAR
jgi:cleavage stimulation factor subunit 2